MLVDSLLTLRKASILAFARRWHDGPLLLCFLTCEVRQADNEKKLSRVPERGLGTHTRGVGGGGGVTSRLRVSRLIEIQRVTVWKDLLMSS